MAEILPFAASAQKRVRPPREGAAGEVVIFPGVRVEYHDGVPPRPTSGQRRGKRNAAKGALSA